MTLTDAILDLLIAIVGIGAILLISFAFSCLLGSFCGFSTGPDDMD